MNSKQHFAALARHGLTATLCLVWAGVQAQTPVAASPPAAAAVPASAGTAAGPRLDFKLPELRDIGLAVPRPVRAATAMLGMGRQRLALVVGMATVGASQVVDNAGRDVLAVAAALREAGFVVMLRMDPGNADLRAALQEFRERLQPAGLGFAYLAGLGAQVDGQNLLLPRDSRLDANLPLAERQAQWLKTGLPLAAVVDALMGPADSARMLVVDAAYRHPAFSGLPAAGLTAQKLPPGMMALFGHPLGRAQEVPAVGALADPPPTAAGDLAASSFARALVGQLLVARRRAPEVLRATHRSLYDSSQGQNDIWLAGETEDVELAEASLLDVIPRTPEELAREAASQAARALSRQTAASAGANATTTAGAAGATAAAAGGEQSVAEVLERLPNSTLPADPTAGDNTRARAARTMADTPQPAAVTANPGSMLGTAVEAAGTAVQVAATVAGVATAAATVAVQARAAEAATAVSLATTALGAAGAVAGQAMALAGRAVSASAGDLPVEAFDPAAKPPPAAATPAAAQRPRPAGPADRGLDGRTVRQADGGERPAYTPRANAYGYAEGDTYTYQVLDTWTDQFINRYTTAIEEVLPDGQMLANGQQMLMDAQGRLKKLAHADGSVSQFEPSQDLWWSNPKHGERRDLRFTETIQRAGGQASEIEWKGSTSVGKLKTIETPAGAFEVLPIESSGWAYEAMPDGLHSTKWSRTVWYSPKLGHPVAIDIEDADRLGKLLKRERVELLHAQATRAATP